MEKEQILSTINEKLEAQGIKTEPFQRTFNDYVSRNLPMDGTEPDDAYWQKHVEILASVSGLVNHEVADIVKKQIEDFKKNYKPEIKTTETKTGEGEESDLEKRLAQLESLLKESGNKATREKLVTEVISKGKSLKVANEAIWEDAVKAVEIGEKDSADTVTANAKKEYERLLKRYHGEGVAPYGNSGRQGSSKEAEEQAKDRREAFKKKMQSRGKLPTENPKN